MHVMLKKEDGVILDIHNNCLRRGGREVPLTEKEKRLLHCLAGHPGEVTRHTDICGGVWPERVAAIGPNNILQLMFRLRGKLKLLGITDGISTISGEGYRLNIRILLNVKGYPCRRCWRVRGVIRKIMSRQAALALLLMAGAAAFALFRR
ncbi:winged helix-turn-helix domain-containing protein [Enterobacter asburiae]